MIQRYDTHFLDKVFTANEIQYCSKKVHQSVHFAGRWASKEAFYKALPLSAQQYATWKSIEVMPQSTSGKPEILVLSPELVNFFKVEMINSLYLSISHEQTICTAMVILE